VLDRREEGELFKALRSSDLQRRMADAEELLKANKK
jgi:hypothetical protein